MESSHFRIPKGDRNFVARPARSVAGGTAKVGAAIARTTPGKVVEATAHYTGTKWAGKKALGFANAAIPFRTPEFGEKAPDLGAKVKAAEVTRLPDAKIEGLSNEANERFNQTQSVAVNVTREKARALRDTNGLANRIIGIDNPAELTGEIEFYGTQSDGKEGYFGNEVKITGIQTQPDGTTKSISGSVQRLIEVDSKNPQSVICEIATAKDTPPIVCSVSRGELLIAQVQAEAEKIKGLFSEPGEQAERDMLDLFLTGASEPDATTRKDALKTAFEPASLSEEATTAAAFRTKLEALRNKYGLITSQTVREIAAERSGYSGDTAPTAEAGKEVSKDQEEAWKKRQPYQVIIDRIENAGGGVVDYADFLQVVSLDYNTGIMSLGQNVQLLRQQVAQNIAPQFELTQAEHALEVATLAHQQMTKNDGAVQNLYRGIQTGGLPRELATGLSNAFVTRDMASLGKNLIPVIDEHFADVADYKQREEKFDKRVSLNKSIRNKVGIGLLLVAFAGANFGLGSTDE
ncbi:MAG: hypothetical protein Q8Q49_00290 [bacterium]|nr:hypothetical protein [bacterium]